MSPIATHFLSAYLLFGGRGRMCYEPSNRCQTYVLLREPRTAGYAQAITRYRPLVSQPLLASLSPTWLPALTTRLVVVTLAT